MQYSSWMSQAYRWATIMYGMQLQWALHRTLDFSPLISPPWSPRSCMIFWPGESVLSSRSPQRALTIYRGYRKVAEGNNKTMLLCATQHKKRQTTDDSPGSSLCSTDPHNGLYITRKERWARRAIFIGREWIDLLDKNAALFGRWFRLHFCLPAVQCRRAKRNMFG